MHNRNLRQGRTRTVATMAALVMSGIFQCAAFHYRIEVNVPDPDMEGSEYDLFDYNDQDYLKTETVKNGKLLFEGESEHSFMGCIRGNHQPKLRTFIVEDTVMTADLDKEDQLSGGRLWNEVQNICQKIETAGDFEDRASILLKTAEENCDNAIGEWALCNYTYFCSPDEWDKAYSTVSNRIRSKFFINKYDEMFKKARATWVGQPFADIQGKDLQGNDVSLSDYVGKGKYVLADFWASWCGPCIRLTKNELIPLYEKYKSDPRLEIIGVASNDNPEDSRKSIERHGFSWPQIIDCGFGPMKAYGFGSIPQLILFAPDGTIVSRAQLHKITLDKLRKILGE